MADLNIRNIDEALMTRLKTAAAARGLTLRAFCISKLDTPDEPPPRKPVFEIDSPAAKRYHEKLFAEQAIAANPGSAEPKETVYEPVDE